MTGELLIAFGVAAISAMLWIIDGTLGRIARALQAKLIPDERIEALERALAEQLACCPDCGGHGYDVRTMTPCRRCESARTILVAVRRRPT